MTAALQPVLGVVGGSGVYELDGRPIRVNEAQERQPRGGGGGGGGRGGGRDRW